MDFPLRAEGFKVLAPAYPGFDVEVEALNADPSPIEEVTVPEIIARIEGIISGSTNRPSSSGIRPVAPCADPARPRVWRRGVAMNSAPTEGVLSRRSPSLTSALPVLKSLANRHKAVGLHLSSGLTRSPTRSRRRIQALSTSATTSRRRARSSGAAYSANLMPGPQDAVRELSQPARAPLLFVPAPRTTSCRRRAAFERAHYKAPGTSPRSRCTLVLASAPCTERLGSDRRRGA